MVNLRPCHLLIVLSLVNRCVRHTLYLDFTVTRPRELVEFPSMLTRAGMAILQPPGGEGR